MSEEDRKRPIGFAQGLHFGHEDSSVGAVVHFRNVRRKMSRYVG